MNQELLKNFTQRLSLSHLDLTLSVLYVMYKGSKNNPKKQ
ncbi:hypothetical protein HMPREF9148_01589 [Prevotella sp. F0091]|nr:hypothetical protein HMPREF9148_01589 [Prevotella sp. F0091]